MSSSATQRDSQADQQLDPGVNAPIVHSEIQQDLHSEVDPEILTVECDATRVVIHLRVQPELSWFTGHFPDVPLLPGVVQTHWVAQFGRRYFDLPPYFHSMSNMKFMRFILPNTPLELHLNYNAAKGELAFEYREAGAVCASGRMGFGAEPATQPNGNV